MYLMLPRLSVLHITLTLLQTEAYTDYSNEAENIHRVSGLETNEIRQVTEGICLKEQVRAEKGG